VIIYGYVYLSLKSSKRALDTPRHQTSMSQIHDSIYSIVPDLYLQRALKSLGGLWKLLHMPDFIYTLGSKII